MADLVLKIPKGKIPFIGVLYTGQGHALAHNQDLIDKAQYKGAEYRLELEFNHAGKANLKLICEEHIILRRFNTLNVDAALFNRWWELVQGYPSFNFGQVALEFDKHVIMRTAVSQQPIVFRIHELKVLERDWSR